MLLFIGLCKGLGRGVSQVLKYPTVQVRGTWSSCSQEQAASFRPFPQLDPSNPYLNRISCPRRAKEGAFWNEYIYSFCIAALFSRNISGFTYDLFCAI
jgi:hypothetical protein